MKKHLEKYETLICILAIAIYLVLNSYLLNNFGTTHYITAIVNLMLSLGIITYIASNKLLDYYSLNAFPKPKKFLYFIPLILLVSLNLIGGIKIVNTLDEILWHVLTMIGVGFLEEIIFRGLLFKMMAKENERLAVIVTTITFGIGHIINLLNGANVIPTLVQIIYATAGGYLFAVVLVKCKSLWPCILTHIGINALSIFNAGNMVTMYIVPILLVVISLGYAVWLNKKYKEYKPE